MCTFAGSFRVREWLGALREATNGDDQIADHLWNLTFPVIWATLAGKPSPLSEKDQQVCCAARAALCSNRVEPFVGQWCSVSTAILAAA